MSLTTRTPEKESEFLSALADTCSVAKACELAGLARRTVYGWRETDADFAEQWDRARLQGADVLEDEAVRRAYRGIEKPIYYKGEQIDVLREYSDTLLIFLLKGAKPEVYKDRVANELSGPGGAPIEIDDSQRANAMAQILAQARQRRDVSDVSDLA